MAEKEEEEVIFISYGREKDVTLFAQQLKRDLEANGFSVWLDQEDISSGSDWHGAIGTGIHKCTFFIPVITQKYAKSRYCMNELYAADGDQKTIFPVLYDDPEHVDFEGTELGRGLKFIISGINWTMFRPGRDDYGESLTKLVKGLKNKENYRTGTEKDSGDDTSVAKLTVGPASSTPVKVISGIQYPAHIATGRNGEIVVASYMSHNVRVYNRDFELTCTFGSQGFMDGQFMCPSGVAVDKLNRVYVSSLSKVDVFTMEGQFLNSVGSQGNGPLQFANAAGMALGKRGEIYVADTQNNRVQVLNSDLSFHTSFSEASSSHGAGSLSQPQAVAVNGEGNVYVADMMNHCVQAFTPEGKHLLSFGEFGAQTVPGSMCSPMAIAIDGHDNVYVGNSNGTVGIYDKQGSFARAFGSYGSKLGQFNTIRGMHVDLKGQLYVSEWMSNRVQIFEGSPSMKKQQDEKEEEAEKEDVSEEQVSSKLAYMIGPTSPTPVKILSGIKEPQGVAEGKNGEVIIASKKENKLYVYDRKDDYKLLATIGSKGDVDGTFRGPYGVTVTHDNLILVSSFNKLQWFTMDGKLVYAVGGNGKEEMEFNFPRDIALSRGGLIYVLDSGNKRVQILSGDGTYRSSFDLPDKDINYTSLAVNSEGNVYLADATNNCVHVFSSCGETLFKFGKSGSVMERGTLHGPNALAIDNDNYVYVASVMMVSIFDKTGTFVRAFGGQGKNPGEFQYITGLCTSKSGHLYVSDHSNDRLQIYEINPCSETEGESLEENIKTVSSSHRPAYTIGPTSDNPVQVISGNEPISVTVAGNGDLFVLHKKKKKVVIFDGETYEPKDEITQLFQETSRDTEIVDPTNIAICEDGCLLMSVSEQLVKFTMAGDVIASVGTKGRSGSKENELCSPRGIAVGKDGRIYVADRGNKRVQIFNPDLSYRGTCFSPSLTSSKDSEMTPDDVAVNSEGTVYVTDYRNNCAYAFSSDGKFLFVFGQLERKDRGSLPSPKAIVIDHQDYMYVSSNHDFISVLDKEGTFVRTFGNSGDDPGKFRDIEAMHIDQKGKLYVCESRNNRIQVFAGILSQSQAEKDWIAATPQREATMYDFVPKVTMTDQIKDPLAIAEGKNGETIVLSGTDHKIYVYDQQYKVTAEFGGTGDLDGYFNSPTSIAVTSDNHVVVSSHDKLQWFTMAGDLVHVVGSTGEGDMEFHHPDSIAIARDAKIYVLEKINKRVQILNGKATYHSSFKLDKNHFPDSLAVNSEGNIYFVDTRNSLIRILSQKGAYLGKISSVGSAYFSRPTAIAVDMQDQVCIGTVSGTVVIFDKQGRYVCAVRGMNDKKAPDSSHFNFIGDLYVTQSRHVYVSNISRNQVQIIGPLEDLTSELEAVAICSDVSPSTRSVLLPYRPIFTIGPCTTTPVRVIEGIKEPSAIISGPNNNILIAGHGDHKIYAYDFSRNHLSAQITKVVRGEKTDGVRYPSGLAFSSNGDLLVSIVNQLLKVNQALTVVAYIGDERKRCGDNNNQLSDPRGIAVGSDGLIYLVDQRNHRIQIYDHNFLYVKTLCNPDSKERSREDLECVALNSTGDLYVTDSYNCKVQMHDCNGRFRFAFGKKAVSSKKYNRGELSQPHAIAIDREDFVYVGDSRGIVSIFDKKGKFLRSFGGSGDMPGQFGDIRAMHIDTQGMLYIGEWKNNRVQVFQGPLLG